MRVIILLFLLTLCACNNNANNKAVNDSTNILELPADSSEADIIELGKEDFYVWQVDNDKKTIAKNPRITEQYLNADTLIIGLNKMFSTIKLEKIKQSNDTLYTQIKDATFLTEQMGSSGSELYIAQAVLNLTSIKGINYVKIDFEEGSHASPDTWSKESFKDYKEVQYYQINK